MTPKRVIEIPRFQIRRIVGAIHVGKSDEYVRVQIRERATGAELARNRYRASRTVRGSVSPGEPETLLRCEGRETVGPFPIR